MKLLYVIFVIAFLTLCVLFAFADRGTSFIRGEFGVKCYINGSEHGNIKYPIFFDSLEDCLASLK